MEGGVAGGVPPHKGGRLRPTAQLQWLVISGQLSVSPLASGAGAQTFGQAACVGYEVGQRPQVLLIFAVAVFLFGRLEQHGHAVPAQIVEDVAEAFYAHKSFADVRVPVFAAAVII